MGRELRRVPAGWEHPKDESGRFVPLFGGSFEAAQEQRYPGDPIRQPEDYMPSWDEGEATHVQVYETVSEGTPTTPPLPTKEALREHLLEHGEFNAFRGERPFPEAVDALLERESVTSGAMFGPESLKVTEPTPRPHSRKCLAPTLLGGRCQNTVTPGRPCAAGH